MNLKQNLLILAKKLKILINNEIVKDDEEQKEVMNTDKIIKLMEEKNITLYRLGKMTNLNESNLGKIVSGKTKDPRISYVKAIADALEVDIDEIVIRNNYK